MLQGRLIKCAESALDVLLSAMRMVSDRAVLTVVRHDGSWAVEWEGQFFGQSSDKDVAKAAANKRAREFQDAGRPCQVCVTGELGFWRTA